MFFPLFPRLTGKEKRIGGCDLIWDDGPVLADDGNMECSINGAVTTSNSFLGRWQLFFIIIIF